MYSIAEKNEAELMNESLLVHVKRELKINLYSKGEKFDLSAVIDIR
jgi:hypothetical protein